MPIDKIKGVRMENIIICISFLIPLLITVLIRRRSRSRAVKNLPPSPWKLPVIGHLHHLAIAGDLTHRSFAKLSHKYGELLFLRLGQVNTVVISSSRLAKEVMRTQDLVFASRPDTLVGRIIFYGSTDIIFSPYGEYWRQLRKICTLELFSAKRVESFGWIRQDEALQMVSLIKSHILENAKPEPINLTQKFARYSSSMMMRAALGDVDEHDRNELVDIVAEVVSLSSFVDISDLFPSLEILHHFLSAKSKMIQARCSLDRVLDSIISRHSSRSENKSGCSEDFIDVILRVIRSGDLQVPITGDFIKAVLIDLFAGGTETSSTTSEWAMAEMIRHPPVMAKAQSEVRRVLGEKRRNIEETEIQELKYLKLVVKETLRLHPPVPLLIPRESKEECEVDGYKIPKKTMVMVNAWAIGRNTEYWDDPESFKPERFENSGVDFTGSHFEFLPFGAGRRMCPGMNFGLANVYVPLAFLLYHFDWEIPNGLSPSELDMTEARGAAVGRENNLLLMPKLIL